MVFNSLQYFIFFPSVAILYFIIPVKQRWKLLLLASIIFYLSFDPKFFALVLFSILSSFYCGLKSDETTDKSKKKLFLYLSIWSNILVLCIFKYYNFFAESAQGLLNVLGLDVSPYLLNIGFPIGISFYTFQIIGYSLDVYYGKCKAEKTLGIYSLYILYFPKLQEGPIEKTKNLLPQLRKEHTFDYERVTSGLKLMGWGLFKKLVIADRLAEFVNFYFDTQHESNGFQALIACYFFIFQLYADFSGYIDMARGASRIFGIELLKNFNHPLFSISLTDFWKKWHISLYEFLYQYVYNPLVFNKRKWGNNKSIIFTIFITLTISGLWHGASWTFVIYGILHAIGLIVEYLLTPFREKMREKVPLFISRTLGMLLTFNFVVLTMVFFRSGSIEKTWNILKAISEIKKTEIGIYVFNNIGTSWEFPLSILFIMILLSFEYLQMKTDNYLSFHKKIPLLVRWLIYAFFILVIIFFGVLTKHEFSYAQF